MDQEPGEVVDHILHYASHNIVPDTTKGSIFYLVPGEEPYKPPTHHLPEVMGDEEFEPGAYESTLNQSVYSQPKVRKDGEIGPNTRQPTECRESREKSRTNENVRLGGSLMSSWEAWSDPDGPQETLQTQPPGDSGTKSGWLSGLWRLISHSTGAESCKRCLSWMRSSSERNTSIRANAP